MIWLAVNNWQFSVCNYANILTANPKKSSFFWQFAYLNLTSFSIIAVINLYRSGHAHKYRLKRYQIPSKQNLARQKSLGVYEVPNFVHY